MGNAVKNLPHFHPRVQPLPIRLRLTGRCFANCIEVFYAVVSITLSGKLTAGDSVVQSVTSLSTVKLISSSRGLFLPVVHVCLAQSSFCNYDTPEFKTNANANANENVKSGKGGEKKEEATASAAATTLRPSCTGRQRKRMLHAD